MPEMPPLPEPVATALELTGFGDCDFYTDAQMHAYARQYAAALEAENERLRGVMPKVLEDLNDKLCDENEALRAERDAYKESLRAITVEGSVVVVRSEYEKMAKAEAERDALKQTVHDEISENLRLREVGGALPDEDMPTFLRRVFAERDALKRDAERWRAAADHVRHYPLVKGEQP